MSETQAQFELTVNRRGLELEPVELRRLVEKKLEVGRRAAKGDFGKERYAQFPDVTALREPLENPEKHLGADEFGREVRFVTMPDGRGVIPLAKAKKAVCGLVVPWLFD